MNLNHDQLQQAILGSLLVFPDELDSVAAKLHAEDFHHEKYRKVFSYLIGNGGGDLITVSHALRGVVSSSELVDWMSREVTSAFLPRYCSELKEIANKIRMANLADEFKSGFADLSFADMYAKFEQVSNRIHQELSIDPVGAAELMKNAIDRLRFRYENRGIIHGLPYGYNDLDKVTCGMHPGELIVVAGRPSMGKSAFACNVLEHVCSSGKIGMLFSLEMSKEMVVDRMICSIGAINAGRLRDGNLQDNEWSKMERAQKSISEFRLFIDDSAGVSLADIRSKAKAMKKDGLDFLVVDYLQLMDTRKADSRTLAIGEISRGLKRLARELEIPIMLLSQLNRAVDARNDKRPLMSDLRDSGEIEQDADVILFPFRPSVYCQKCKDRVDNDEHVLADCMAAAEVIVEKQRNGERNLSIKLMWQGQFQRFVSLPNLPDF
jgi:replicative DNA helicase